MGKTSGVEVEFYIAKNGIIRRSAGCRCIAVTFARLTHAQRHYRADGMNKGRESGTRTTTAMNASTSRHTLYRNKAHVVPNTANNTCAWWA